MYCLHGPFSPTSFSFSSGGVFSFSFFLLVTCPQRKKLTFMRKWARDSSLSSPLPLLPFLCPWSRAICVRSPIPSLPWPPLLLGCWASNTKTQDRRKPPSVTRPGNGPGFFPPPFFPSPSNRYKENSSRLSRILSPPSFSIREAEGR